MLFSKTNYTAKVCVNSKLSSRYQNEIVFTLFTPGDPGLQARHAEDSGGMAGYPADRRSAASILLLDATPNGPGHTQTVQP